MYESFFQFMSSNRSASIWHRVCNVQHREEDPDTLPGAGKHNRALRTVVVLYTNHSNAGILINR